MDPPWIEPYPDVLLEALGDNPLPDGAARFDFNESLTLDFVAALQQLPPRQRSVVTLHDVMAFPEAEVATMLGVDLGEVRRALELARASLDSSLAGARDLPAPARHSASERKIVDRFARAFEAGDVDRLLALLTPDAKLTTPPEPEEYRGVEAIGAFLRDRCDHRAGRRYRLVPTRANTQPAFACYLEDPHTPIARANGLIVLTLEGDRISAITRFVDNSLYQLFRLPRILYEGTRTDVRDLPDGGAPDA